MSTIEDDSFGRITHNIFFLSFWFTLLRRICFNQAAPQRFQFKFMMNSTFSWSHWTTCHFTVHSPTSLMTYQCQTYLSLIYVCIYLQRRDVIAEWSNTKKKDQALSWWCKQNTLIIQLIIRQGLLWFLFFLLLVFNTIISFMFRNLPFTTDLFIIIFGIGPSKMYVSISWGIICFVRIRRIGSSSSSSNSSRSSSTTHKHFSHFSNEENERNSNTRENIFVWFGADSVCDILFVACWSLWHTTKSEY